MNHNNLVILDSFQKICHQFEDIQLEEHFATGSTSGELTEQQHRVVQDRGVRKFTETRK